MTSWKQVPLIALDLEGTGAQDRDREAILEIALVPIIGGRPEPGDAYTTLINPQRPIPRRPWISPGLTDAALATAPTLDDVAPELITRLTGKILVAHNIGVDWRLLQRRCPGIHPGGLIDTLRLARHSHQQHQNERTQSKGLTALLEHYNLADTVNQLAPDSRPHRALWDTIGTAVLLSALVETLPDSASLTLTKLRRIASHPDDSTLASPSDGEQTSLLDI